MTPGSPHEKLPRLGLEHDTMDYRKLHPHLSDERYAVTLWYASVPLAHLLADMDAIGQSLHGNQMMRVYTNQQEALTAVPALCAARGFVLLPTPTEEPGEGDTRSYGRYRFDIGGSRQ
jgi:hypothetical protein